MIKRVYIIFFIFFLLFLTIVSASPQDLVSSFNFDFNLNNTLIVQEQADFMQDTNNNFINDFLFFNLSIKANVEGIYKFLIDIKDVNTIITAKAIEYVNIDTASILVNVSTEHLTGSKFNYSLKVYDESGKLIFRKFRQQTKEYLDYETGFKVLEVSDENINNNFIRINFKINSTKLRSENVTLFMKFDDSFISSLKEIIFNAGQNNGFIDFDSEIIKSTHYSGVYIIDTLKIGEKIIDLNQATALYEFEDFAKTSYFISYSDTVADINSDDLIEFIEINYILNIKQAGNYKIESQLFDNLENFVVPISQQVYLPAGINTVNVLINGSEIYKSKIDSPYIIKFAKLENNSGDLIDYVIEPYDLINSNFVFTEFERPSLPDLKISMNVKYNNSDNLINLTVENIGSAPAFNIFVDIFDNKTYNDQYHYAILNGGDSQEFNFIASNTKNNSMFAAVVDFDNLIDELDEENNIVSNIESKPIILPNDTYRFYFRNFLGESVAWFGDKGNIALRGTCTTSNNCIAPQNSFIVANFTDSTTAYIDEQGNICIEKGDCSDQSPECDTTKDAFIIKNSSDYNKIYIDFDGDLCLTGRLFEEYL